MLGAISCDGHEAQACGEKTDWRARAKAIIRARILAFYDFLRCFSCVFGTLSVVAAVLSNAVAARSDMFRTPAEISSEKIRRVRAGKFSFYETAM